MIFGHRRRIDRWMLQRVVLLVVVTVLGDPVSARQARGVVAPQDVVRLFCQADGRGDRIHPRRWAAVAPLVNWALEPAWDQVWLISGYQVMPPRSVVIQAEGGERTEPRLQVEIDVEYTVVKQVSAAGVENAAGSERTTLRLAGDDVSGWRIDPPPPPVRVFASAVDIEAMHASLQPDSSSYLSASALVWRMLSDSGWQVPYRPVSGLLDPNTFVAIEKPDPADLALFLDDNRPYHVGIVAEEGQILSATVNAGAVRTSPREFAGTVLYLRPLAEAKTPTGSPEVPEQSPTPNSENATPPATPEPSGPATSSPPQR